MPEISGMGPQGEGARGEGERVFYVETVEGCQIGENRSEMCQDVTKLS